LRTPQEVTLTTRLFRAGRGVPVTIGYPDGTTEELSIGGKRTALSRRLTLPPGVHPIRLTVRGPKMDVPRDPRTHYLGVADFRLVAHPAG
jgi:hypothetical protein